MNSFPFEMSDSSVNESSVKQEIFTQSLFLHVWDSLIFRAQRTWLNATGQYHHMSFTLTISCSAFDIVFFTPTISFNVFRWISTQFNIKMTVVWQTRPSLLVLIAISKDIKSRIKYKIWNKIEVLIYTLNKWWLRFTCMIMIT